LQPYKVILVENPELRAKNTAISLGQSQIVEASHLIVFANEINFGTQELMITSKTQAKQETTAESLQGYADFMKANITALSEDIRK
jgi:nitroreductase